MMNTRALVKRGLARLGLELVRTGSAPPSGTPLQDTLHRMQRLGVSPRTVLDFGAAHGRWSRRCASVYPDAHYVLVEPVPAYRPHLEAWDAAPSTYVPEAGGSEIGKAVLHIHADLVGSSLYREEVGDWLDGEEQVVPVTTADALSAERQSPFAIKADVQGAELDIMRGATEALARTDFVVLEVSLFGFLKGAPDIAAVIAYMREQNFVIYDIHSPQHRLLDGALGQVDLVFVPHDSVLRAHHIWGTDDQMADQIERFTS